MASIFDLDKPVIAAVRNSYAFRRRFLASWRWRRTLLSAPKTPVSRAGSKLGIVPDSGGVLRLPKLLPPAIVNEMVMTGRRMSAEEALR
ncbi:hypothetical protein KCP73_07870 [Salmonella enterica subsp. enterica]|nr:hypothetical protein KCP73_07870 [Salmonella enterica subsp. enterica]